jgi:L-erythro-3,5-diaminohexanoate dehydrogenase
VIGGDVTAPASPLGLHRVLGPIGVLPQAAHALDDRPELWPDEVRLDVERLALDAASFRQLHGAHLGDGDGMRAEVLRIVAARGKMQNPVTGSGGMLVGTVADVGPVSPLGLTAGDRVASLASLTLTPLRITDGLTRWDGQSEQVPAGGHAILFGRSIAAVLPDDLDTTLALALFHVCGAPALTARVVGGLTAPSADAGRHTGRRAVTPAAPPTVAVLGGSGKSGSLSLAAARRSGAGRTVGVVPSPAEAERLTEAALADTVTVADARDPVAVSTAVTDSLGGPADLVVACVDIPGCEGGAVLSAAQGGTVVFCSRATSFTAAALGAEGLAADVTMLIGNGFVPGHAHLVLHLWRTEEGVRQLFAGRVAQETSATAARRA